MSPVATEIEIAWVGHAPPHAIASIYTGNYTTSATWRQSPMGFALKVAALHWLVAAGQYADAIEANRQRNYCRADVSQQTTSICIVDEEEVFVLAERKVTTCPDVIAAALEPFALTRAGLETRPLVGVWLSGTG
jgi:hypothetical protein